MNIQWCNFVPEAKRILYEQGLSALCAVLKSGPQTRWINDLLPQIKRVLLKGKRAILLLGFCPLSNDPMPDLDQPSCKTLKVASGLEMPDGIPVILLDLRKDCIRVRKVKPNGSETENCLHITAPEREASLQHLVFEIYIITKIFDIQISSVLTFSEF